MVANAFVLCKVRHNVSLSPCHAMDARVGIEQDLTEQLMRYSEALKGVVLSFSNVQLARPHGVIVNEMPFIHCKVLADALVFRPKEGMVLRGIVNKIGSNHVGMLFAGVFNGSVTEAELPKGYVHNYAQDCWLGEDGSSIAVENEVDVKVLRVHVAGGMIAIEATMRFEGAAVVKKAVKKVKKAKHLNLAAGEPVAKAKHLNLAAGEPVTKSIKEKKSKKTKKIDEEVIDLGKEKKTKKTKKIDEKVIDLGKEKKSKKAKKIDEEVIDLGKEKKSKKAKKIDEEVIDLGKEKKTKKTKTIAEEVVKTKKDKKSKKRRHEEPTEEVVPEETAVVEEVVVKSKKHNHKDKDAKKKKHKKSKHD